MRITHAMLAQAANVTHGGTLHMFEGGIDTIAAKEFPVSRLPISIVLLGTAEPSEAGVQCEVRTEIRSSEGYRAEVDRKWVVLAKNKHDESASSSIIFALNVMIDLPSPGKYEFYVFIHDELTASIDLYAELEQEQGRASKAIQ